MRAQVSSPSSEPPSASLQSAANRAQLRPGAVARSAGFDGRRQLAGRARASPARLVGVRARIDGVVVAVDRWPGRVCGLLVTAQRLRAWVRAAFVKNSTLTDSPFSATTALNLFQYVSSLAASLATSRKL